MTDFGKNTWQTPPECANYVKRRWAIKWDGAATVENKICDYFITPEIDFLNFESIDRIIENNARIFINPPYGRGYVEKFVKQAVRLMNEKRCFVVMLLNADKSTEWFKLIREHATEVIDIVGKRVAFINPITKKPVEDNPKWQMFAVFDPYAEGFVTSYVSYDKIKQVGTNDNNA
ncbi:phage N-6-adenine-methyltransferase [Actinobacillus equuli subsp. haemolyticus]|uniref:DNA N-6-adenine-methyltransferase n=1 Tax=Actinobacillus equuli TaxID=718 RepID=UPI0024420753|nr:DNA N-6-adenine-methyltransferase [Actinobacillus equuli]WGE81814.1 phage N-6-adenine-methyltransferase [Actinobacillus equuli subsp. haemolyticus]